MAEIGLPRPRAPSPRACSGAGGMFTARGGVRPIPRFLETLHRGEARFTLPAFVERRKQAATNLEIDAVSPGFTPRPFVECLPVTTAYA